jgi:hypothetical protein
MYSLQADLQVQMVEMDTRLTALLGDRKLTSPILSSWSSSILADTNSMTSLKNELDYSEQWRKWSGNYPLDPITSSPAPAVTRVGEYLSIPFKPLFWQKKLQQPSNPTYLEVVSGLDGSDDASPRDLLSMEQFLRSIPWLFIFLYEGINDLEDFINEETYGDQQVISKEGDPMALSIIRHGEVLVTKKHPLNPAQQMPVHKLKR